MSPPDLFINIPYRPSAYPLLTAYVCLAVANNIRPRIMAEWTVPQRAGESGVKLLADGMKQCRYSIHEISWLRRNVFYELGLAHGLDLAGHPHQALVFSRSATRAFSDIDFLYSIRHGGIPLHVFQGASAHLARGDGSTIAPAVIEEFRGKVVATFQAWCRTRHCGRPTGYAFSAPGFRDLASIAVDAWDARAATTSRRRRPTG